MSITGIAHDHRLRRHTLANYLGVALLGVVLPIVGATACGNETRGDATGTTLVVSTSVAVSATFEPATTVTPTTVTPTTVPSERPTAPVDELVGIDGERVHVRCAGTGDTTVLLIAGFETGSEAWSMVAPDIAGRARVCAHDRPGTGTSDPATSTQTFASQATDLHDLLAAVGEPGPYVVVGHSFGGAEGVTFASMFADEVVGLVLVDASPVTWPAAICAVADDGTDAATMLRGFCAGWSDPNANTEHLDVFAAFAGASTITSLGSLPLTVITAVDRTLPVGLAAGEVARLTSVWDDGQHRWSRLSESSRVVPVENTGHHIEIDHPDLVIDEIGRLLPQ